MNYLTAKESRVERAWNKRGLAGLRSELLQRVGEQSKRDVENSELVTGVARMVYSVLPQREWDKADVYIAETCGLVGVDSDEFVAEVMQVRQGEEILREDEGGE